MSKFKVLMKQESTVYIEDVIEAATAEDARLQAEAALDNGKLTAESESGGFNSNVVFERSIYEEPEPL